MELVLLLGQGGEGVDRQQQLAGFLLVDVEDLHLDLHFRVDVAAQMAVDQFEAAIGELEGEQAAGEADLLVNGGQAGFLVRRSCAQTGTIGAFAALAVIESI